MDIDMAWFRNINSICVRAIFRSTNMKIGETNVVAFVYTDMCFWAVKMSMTAYNWRFYIWRSLEPAKIINKTENTYNWIMLFGHIELILKFDEAM